ncbi:MAG: hypothetical protein LIO65_05085 [Odoribacter sp.]|nr:hypothetical protein [Odoribacter sp.]
MNTIDDPTNTMERRENWLLSFTLFNDDNSVYPYGHGTFKWDATDSYWKPDSSLYFPNYLRKRISARLYPDDWTEIALDQSATDASAILGQDILIQNGNQTYPINALSHIMEIEMQHAHSMLDFRFVGIEETDLHSVIVEVGGSEYIPYQVKNGENPEYMVIIPVNSSEPIIRINTQGGARYYQTTVNGISSTQVNNCYCFTFKGLELLLSEITIATWTTGPGIPGDYTTEQSYPTFRGPANSECTIYYDNGLNQTLSFNERGESTQKPAGRTIIRITTPGGINTTLNPPVVLSGMIVNLIPYLGS